METTFKIVLDRRRVLAEDWNVNSVDRDYGQDLNIEIAEDGVYRGLELIVQLKSSKERQGTHEYESQTKNSLQCVLKSKELQTDVAKVSR